MIFPIRISAILALIAFAASGQAEDLEISLVTGKPTGKLAVAGRLSVDLHAEFMLSREYGSERALNWYSCGYSGGGAGGSTVGGAFGDFGFQVPFKQRPIRYPLAVDADGIPSVQFDGDDFLLGNLAIEPAILETGKMTLEIWFQTDGPSAGSVLLAWQSKDGRESTGIVGVPETGEAAAKWRHLVIVCDGATETHWLDGTRSPPTARRLLPRPDHLMVLGGQSSLRPSFKGRIAAVRLHDSTLAEAEIARNHAGGVMLGTEIHDWWATEPDRWWIQDSEFFRHAVDKKEMASWPEQELVAFEKRLPEMFELAELCYHVYSERLAMRSSVVSVKPEQRGDGIKYRIPIQATQGSWMGFDGSFGWACQGAGFINPHELVHGWQAMTGGMAGNYWETHANFPQTYLGVYQTVPVIAMESPAFPSSGRTYYHDRGVFEHLAQTPEYGPMFISKLWYDGPTPENPSPYPWITFQKINPLPERTLAREFTRAVMRNVTMDYRIHREFKSGIRYRDGEEAAENLYRKIALEQSAPPQQALLRGRTVLEPSPDGAGWWRVPRSRAPQQLGHNICPLVFQPGPVTALLRGYRDEGRGGDWHAGFVGVKADGSPVYGPVFRAGEAGAFDAGADLRELYLVVCATPEKILDIPMTGDFRSFEQEPFPWQVRLGGCSPREPLAEKTPPGEGKPHAHGGGFVAATATVEETAWVGPDARVLGNSRVSGSARIEDHAVILDSTVADSAIVSDYALVMGGSTVSGHAKIRGHAVVKESSTVTGDARVLEHAVIATGKTCGGHVTVKGTSSVYGGNQRGTAILDGWYAKGNEIDKGKWFTWSWGAGKNPGEEDVEFSGLYADYTFDRPHGWMARDDHGATWGYGGTSAAPVIRRDPLAGGPADGALVFDGTSSGVELPRDIADFRQATYTIEFAWDGKSPGASLLEFSGPGGTMALTPSLDGKMIFAITSGQTREILSAPAPSPGQWVRVRVVLDTPAALMQVNGTTVATSNRMTLRPDSIRAARGYLGRGRGGAAFGGSIGRFTVHSIPLVDKVPPAPDPAEFELAPSFVSPGTLLMIATTGADPLGGVEYFFEEEGSRWNSGWTKERILKLEGRDIARPLHYRLRMRDRNGNQTAWSKPLRSTGHPSGARVRTVGKIGATVIEAEDALRTVASADGASIWREENQPGGAMGRGFMVVPDHGRLNDPFRPDGARLDYALRFEVSGSHYLWVRASGNNDGGQFIHAGIGLDPGTWGIKAKTGFGRFTWTRLPAFSITRPGDHLLSLWMCEDGAMIDRIIVTADEMFVPSPETREAGGILPGPGPEPTPFLTIP